MQREDVIHQASGAIDQARYSADKKAAVHAMFEAILDRLDDLQRRPDPREETCLVHALNFMEVGIYARARMELDSCLLSATERPSWRAQQASRNPLRYTVARLRMRLGAVIAAVR